MHDRLAIAPSSVWLVLVPCWFTACDETALRDADLDAALDAAIDPDSDSDADGAFDSDLYQDVDESVVHPIRPYRLALQIDVVGFERLDATAELRVDFTELLTNAGISGSLDESSLTLVEVDEARRDIASDVPFQFDRALDYDAQTRASGTIVLLLDGTTVATHTRRYHLYLDIDDGGYEPPTFAPLVTLTDGEDEGQSGFTITGAGGTLFYQRDAGGFSSMDDHDGNDWLGHNAEPGSGSSGEFRGIPNTIYPEGLFHPGSHDATSTIEGQGPLKVTLRTTTNDDTWECLWEIYSGHATMTMLAAGHNYWFLYEGTPGGALEPETDFMIHSDGSETLLSEPWNGDIAGEEWVAFTDPALGRSLFAAHHEDDNLEDLYYPMEGNMTVFGFGRSSSPLAGLISDVPHRFSVGLVSTMDHARITTIIRSIMLPPMVTFGELEATE